MSKRQSAFPATDRSRPPGQSEHEVLEFWVQLGDLLGLPRSVGQVYGLLFVRELPLCAEHCVAALGISRSSVGQALRQLAALGAIRPVLNPGARGEHFQVEPDLGILVSNLLSRRITPALADLGTRLERLKTSTSEPALRQRLEKIERWKNKALPIAALINQIGQGNR